MIKRDLLIQERRSLCPLCERQFQGHERRS